MDGRALFGLIFYGHCIQGATTFWPHSCICNAIYHILLGRAKSTRTRAQAHVVSLRHLLYAPERDRFMLLYEHIICRSYRVACLTQPSNDRKSDNFSTYEKTHHGQTYRTEPSVQNQEKWDRFGLFRYRTMLPKASRVIPCLCIWEDIKCMNINSN